LTRRVLALQVLAWTAYGVVHFAASLPAILEEERSVMALAAAVRAVTGMAVSTAFTPILPAVVGTTRLRLGAISLLIVIAAGFAWTLVDRAALVSLASALRLEIPWDRFTRGMDLQYFFVMTAWITGYVSLLLDARNRAQREQLLLREVEMRELRLNLLGAQLNPHFLFNSLNTIRSLASEDPARTREVVSRLSSFLRQVIDVKPADLVPVSREIELARDYLEVEKARFEDGLDVSVDADPRVVRSLVPPLILQPLLENAVRHGMPVGGVLTVSVNAAARNEELHLSVSNSGSIEAGTEGTGMRITRERLDHTFPGRYRLHVGNEGNTVTALITLPLT
jgi:hypothetical protein